jgi:hypothetical protein
MIWLPLQAQAELIGTGQAAAAGQAHAARLMLAGKLEVLGIPGDSARERVAALSDAEVLQLAREVDAAPAGGVIWPLLLVAVFLVWRFGFSEQAQAEQKARDREAQREKK